MKSGSGVSRFHGSLYFSQSNYAKFGPDPSEDLRVYRERAL